MLSLFAQVGTLFIFSAIGYVLAKARIVNSEHSKILSSVLVFVFLPCNILKSLTKNFTIEYLKAYYKLLLISVASLVLIIIVAHFVAKLIAKDKYERYIHEYSLIVPNAGYMGYVLAESLMGSPGLVNIITFNTPYSLYINTYAFARLTKREMNFKKLCNSVTISTVIGIIVGLSGLELPEFVIGILEKSSACMGPISMLLTGIVVSQAPLLKVLKRKSVYPTVLIRLVVLPIVLGLALTPFFDKEIVKLVVLFFGLPCGLNTIVFPKLIDENCETGIGIAIVSTTLCCITLPIILWAFGF